MTHTNGTETAKTSLIQRMKVSGLLSFGPQGIDLPMKRLNIFIGANGSGKSNFIEILSLLRAASKGPFGSEGEWLWKGEGDHTGPEGTIDVTISNPKGAVDLRHVLTVYQSRFRLEVADERIEDEGVLEADEGPGAHYRYQRGTPKLYELMGPRVITGSVHPDRSVLGQVKDPDRYPELARIESAYGGVRLFRSWQFGPFASLRKEQSMQLPSDFLMEEGGDNLALVLNEMLTTVRPRLTEFLTKLYDGAGAIRNERVGGAIQLFLRESGDRQIRATRLSDGTLRYLALLAILLHPNPPPLIAIEEPELGLHPDVIHHVADLLKDAAQRTQLIVTTHSRLLIDEMADQPDSVIVCERSDGESSFKRLDAEYLKSWLDRYSLGELWSIGKIGGNRW